MRDIFPYTRLWKYPHMKPADIAIWERFIDKYPNYYDSVQYDFHVGDPPPFNPLLDDDTDINQDALYRLKIDVVGHKGNEIDIIEIKPRAQASTIGQVQAYKRLYIRDEAVKGRINTVILTDQISSNMEYLCRQENVKLFGV